jgi:hypothetical protein
MHAKGGELSVLHNRLEGRGKDITSIALGTVRCPDLSGAGKEVLNSSHPCNGMFRHFPGIVRQEKNGTGDHYVN